MTETEDDPSRKTDPPEPSGPDEVAQKKVKPAASSESAEDGTADDRTVFSETDGSKPGAKDGIRQVSDSPDNAQTSGTSADADADKTVFSGSADANEAGDEDAPQTMISSDASPISPPVPPPAEPTVIGEQPASQAAEIRIVEPGTLINNNYRIVSLVSSGGMGEVYRAENVFTGDPVAVKVILPNLAQDESVLDMFRREARVLVQLRDEAIVRYHNFVLDGGLNRYCLIMEFVEGRHLGARVKEDGPLSDDAAITLLRRLARGLERSHGRGVTHRDLSPDNVILRDDRIDEAVLIDFGIARSTELGDGLAGRFAGKFKYIAPEQLGHFGGDIQPETDVYGLALLMAMVLRGKPLDMGDSIVSASAARQAIPDLTGVPHRLLPLLQHMLEPDPKRRPETMGTVLRMLNDPAMIPAQYRLPLWTVTGNPSGDDSGAGGFQTLIGQTAPQDSSSPFARPPEAGVMESVPSGSPLARSERSQAWTILIAVIVLALAAAAGVGWWMKRESGQPPAVTEAEIEEPKELAARDTSTREGFLASQSLPACSFADRIATGQNAGMVSVLSNTSFPSSGLVDAYEAEFGTRPTIIETQVMPQHCPALEFLREVSGRPAAPPMLTATIRSAEEGYQLVGSVNADTARQLWLFLVSPTGGIYDLTGQSSETSDGRQFGVGISAVQADDDPAVAPFLLVALTTEKPIAAVAAAPAGASADELLPRVLQELHANEENPAVSVLALRAKAPADVPAVDNAEASESDDADEETAN
ncbi:serine/threonine-protein kinase [Paracoccus onubensis]|uniref:Serine/threonine protein kinase n=1 Tax=Paracoccus onubensis TaxID=1675788 RepID=A0A418T3Z9_9RHOB|nr:serine/threonine-protein kinase [Paracoccus onubensis]RJE87914.1 serine/threonine protein kinase [Paracoccus onubensis]